MLSIGRSGTLSVQILHWRACIHSIVVADIKVAKPQSKPPKLQAMANSSTRRINIYINGKEVAASVKQIWAEINRLVNEQDRNPM